MATPLPGVTFALSRSHRMMGISLFETLSLKDEPPVTWVTNGPLLFPAPRRRGTAHWVLEGVRCPAAKALNFSKARDSLRSPIKPQSLSPTPHPPIPRYEKQGLFFLPRSKF